MSFIIQPFFSLNKSSTTTPGGLILDNVSGAESAYSVRLLSSGYTGSCMKVRRSSDNTEQDIGFDNGLIDTTALETFVGAGNNGFVSVWYDQTGNGFHMSQSTNGNQPRIVNSGSTELSGGLPALNFINGSQHYLDNFTYSLSMPFTYYCLTNLSASTGITPGVIWTTIASGNFAFVYHTGNNDAPLDHLRVANICDCEVSQTGQRLVGTKFESGSPFVRIQGSESFSGTQSLPAVIAGLRLGQIFGNPNPIVGFYDFSGHQSEHIIFAGDKTSDVNTIESDINNFFSVY